MKTAAAGKNDSPGATPESDRHKRKFAHERPHEEESAFDATDEQKARRKLNAVRSKNFEELESIFPSQILPGFLYLNRRMMVSGKPISGKGLLLGQTSCCVATGENWLGVKPGEPKNVFPSGFRADGGAASAAY